MRPRLRAELALWSLRAELALWLGGRVRRLSNWLYRCADEFPPEFYTDWVPMDAKLREYEHRLGIEG